MSGITMKISIAEFLHDSHGGKWTFNGKGTWYCDDNNRRVDIEILDIDEPAEYWMRYKDGTKPERVI
jgi:hypothetical protein